MYRSTGNEALLRSAFATNLCNELRPKVMAGSGRGQVCRECRSSTELLILMLLRAEKVINLRQNSVPFVTYFASNYYIKSCSECLQLSYGSTPNEHTIHTGIRLNISNPIENT